MKIKCIIVDDEFLARTLLEDYISKLPNLELMEKCASAPEAMAVLQSEEVDLIFLDVQMPELSGIDFLKTLKNKQIVIFTTAYPEYALEGYSLDVIDFLLKPISFERFVQAVNKAINQIRMIKNEGDKTKEFITLKSEHRVHRVDCENILYIEGLKEYVIFHLKEGKRIITLEALIRLEEILPGNFMRIHRSYIINKNEARSLFGNMIEIGDKKLGIGKTYKSKVIEVLFK